MVKKATLGRTAMVKLICWKYYLHIKLKNQNYYLSIHAMLNVSISQLYVQRSS